MKKTFIILQIIFSVGLVCLILLQAKGSVLGKTFGGANTSYHSKKGVEKMVFVSTVVLATCFLITSLTIAFLP